MTVPPRRYSRLNNRTSASTCKNRKKIIRLSGEIDGLCSACKEGVKTGWALLAFGTGQINRGHLDEDEFAVVFPQTGTAADAAGSEGDESSSRFSRFESARKSVAV